MLADSVKVKGFSCFKDNWVGFDEFKPITVIIGRNNSGKSHLIDLVEAITKSDYFDTGNGKLIREYNGTIDQDFIRSAIEHTKQSNHPLPAFGGGGLKAKISEGLLKIDSAKFFEKYPQLNISWKTSFEGNSVITKSEPYQMESDYSELITPYLLFVKSNLDGKILRRINADRDIVPEGRPQNINAKTLFSDGKGATQIIERFTNGDIGIYPERVIQRTLLEALKFIFGKDCDFDRISIRQSRNVNGCIEIHLNEPGKDLVPLSSSGSGLKTVILVLLNLLVIPELSEKQDKNKRPLTDYVFAFEELENNLHPALLRRLFDYLKDYVKEHKCHLFLTTHSSVALDYFSTLEEAQIIQVTHDGTSASAKTIEAHFDKVGVLNDLGAKPSDLLQANGIIWLEGPSDRIYLNKFIELYSDGKLREGRDYQCAFYGGSVIKRIMFSSPEESDESCANLLTVNNNIAVICDGDRTAKTGVNSQIKGQVLEIQNQVGSIDSSYLWISKAKEIENYIPGAVWSTVFDVPNIPNPGQCDRFPKSAKKNSDFFKKHVGISTFNKFDFASKAIKHLTKENLADRFELKVKMEELVETIKKWNN